MMTIDERRAYQVAIELSGAQFCSTCAFARVVGRDCRHTHFDRRYRQPDDRITFDGVCGWNLDASKWCACAGPRV